MIRDTIDKIKAMFSSRSLAYHRVFNKDSMDTKIVLKDLAKFCRAYETTYHADPRIHALLEGRKEVWMRIQEHLNLSVEELLKLHQVKDMVQGDRK